MALSSTDITPRLANTEMGDTLPTTNLTIKQVCELAGQNPFSFYGPWHLSTVFATKVCEVDYKTSNYSLGDFRLYNHSQVSTGIPKGPDDYEQYYDDSGSTATVTMVSYCYNMNVLDALEGVYSSSALYMCHDFYTSSAARTTGTSPTFRDYSNTLNWETAPVLTDHIRSDTEKTQSQQIHIIPTVPVNAPYADTYISTISGVRVLTLGETIADGYTDLTFTAYPDPYYQGLFTTADSPPVTGCHVAISATGTLCNDDTPVTASTGTSWTITTRLKGASTGSQYIVAATAVTITFKHYSNNGATLLETDTRTAQVFSNTSSKTFSGTWADGMGVGHVVKIEVTAATWGALAGTPCP